MKFQKRSKNFYSKSDINTIDMKQNNEENYNGNKLSQYQLNEGKTYLKNKINSPSIGEKNNLVINNNDLIHPDKQYIYESASKISNNNFSFKNILNNEKNLRYMNNKYYTDYNNEKEEIYYKELQSKIYKKVIDQFYNRVHKYCLKLILNDVSIFLKNLKEFSLNKKHVQKTYKKKNISNKNVCKYKKTIDKLVEPKKLIGDIPTSSSEKYKTIKREKNKLFNINTSVNRSKCKIVYSNYYNLNIFENNTNNKFIYSNKRNKEKFQNEFTCGDNKTLNDKNINTTSLEDIHKINENNNIIYNHKNRKNIIKSNLKKNPNINFTNFNQPKNYYNLSKDKKNKLKIDNENSLAYNATKKKIIDKLQNIKLFRQSSDNNNLDKKEKSEEDELNMKKGHFKNLMTKLKKISFYKHIEKLVDIRNNKIIREFFDILKYIESVNKENSKNNINPNENIDITNNNIKESKNIENENDNIINLNKEDISDKIEINYGKNEEENSKENNEIKNIEINDEKKDKKDISEYNINNDDKNTNPNNIKDNNKDITIEYNLEIDHEQNLNENNNKVNNNNINDEENIQENTNKMKIEETNINSQPKEEKNEKEKVIEEANSENKIEDINTSINKQENEKKETIIKNENINENEDNQKEEIKNEIKENDNNKINIFNEKILNFILLKSKKDNDDIIKKYFIKWKQIQKINTENKNKIINVNEENNETNIPENVIERKEEKRNFKNIKTLFIDEIDDEEKEVILEDMIFRFRTLLILSFLKNKENLSDSFE